MSDPTRVYALIGQSNALRLFSSYLVSNSEPLYLSTDGVTWGNATFAGVKQMLSRIYGVTGQSAGVIGSAVGATALTAESAAISGKPYWLDETPGGLYDDFATACTGHTIDAILWLQGEADAGAPPDNVGSVYYDALTTLWTRIKSDITFKAAPRFVVMGIGSTTREADTDAGWSAVRLAQRLWCAHQPDAVWAGDTITHAMSDYVHLNQAGCELAGKRFAQAILHADGLTTYGVGPHITGWAQSGTTLDVTLAHDGGTDFMPTSGITGFTALDAAGNALTISAAARHAAATLRLTLAASTPVARLHYLYGKAPIITGAVADNSTLALPLDAYSNEAIAVPDSAAIDLIYTGTPPFKIERRVV